MKKKPDELDPRVIQICKRLKQIRIDKQYKSYEDFAISHGIGRMSYWRIEKGTNMTLNTLFKYLDIHKITIEEFFLYEQEKNIKQNGKLN